MCYEVIGIEHIGISLEAGELDASDVSGVFEEPGELLAVDQLPAVRIGPVESLFGNVLEDQQRIAGADQSGFLIGRRQPEDTGFESRRPIDAGCSRVAFRKNQSVVVQCHSITGQYHVTAVVVRGVPPGVFGLDQNGKRFARRQFRRQDHDESDRFAADESEHGRIDDRLEALASINGHGKDASCFAEGLRSRAGGA